METWVVAAAVALVALVAVATWWSARVTKGPAADVRAPAPPSTRAWHLHMWHDVQARFVDDPIGALRDADALVRRVMRAHGQVSTDFERRLTRAAIGAAGHAADTEELRRVLVAYRSLLEELLGEDEARATG